MSPKHVISQFQDWFEQHLQEDDLRMVETHLEHCSKCRDYYSKMASLVETPDEEFFPELEPDPYLATRVKAQALQNSRVFKPMHWLRWTLVGAVSSIAILVGVELGNSLYTATQSDSGTEIVSTYYQAFSQQSIADQWQDVIQTNQESNK
jgi:predicted anti-sigma-YlaC factor YlaD